jgi:hypothetical protein
MRILSFAIVLALSTATGCRYGEVDVNPDYLAENCPRFQSDMPTCATPDLASSVPKCAAAKGLAGDALVCIDADRITLADLRTQGWTGFKDGTGTDCWEIATGKLQVKNFGGFVGTCSFTMPLTDLASPANQKYQSVTLAVVQRVDLNPVSQKAQMMLGLDDPTTRLIEFRTGSNPRQQNINAVSRGDLTAISGTSFQPLFKVTSSLASGATATGVQIESIAVMGNP